jgi:hypothetical protein
MSIVRIGPNEVGLVIKRWGREKKSAGPLALNGEAGYQANLLMPGLAFRIWPINRVEKHPWAQIPTGEVGLVVAQVGAPLPTGWKSGVYKREFGQFTDVRAFLAGGGEQGVQRPVLPPGAIVPLHPVAFLVLTESRSFGLPVNAEYRGKFGPALFGLRAEDLTLRVIEPLRIREAGVDKTIDMVGIVETLEGEPLPSGDIACRLGRFDDVKAMEADRRRDTEIADVLIGNQNERHNNYQDYQRFLDAGGRIGLQHDPLLYGSYALNPYLVRVETVPMLVVKQGEVAVIKAAVGLPTDGEAAYIEQTGRARGAEIEAVGLARAKGFAAQKDALGADTTALVNVISELAKSPNRFVPDIMVTGSSGVSDAMSAGVMGFLRAFQRQNRPTPPA